MSDFKSRCHKLYTISRNEEFINDISNVVSLTSNDKQRELMFLIHSQDNTLNVNKLAQFLMSYQNSIDLSLIDSSGCNAWHYVCKLGHLRMLKLLMSITPKEETVKYLNTRNKVCMHFFLLWRLFLTTFLFNCDGSNT